MAKDRPARQQAVLKYPSHWFKPEDLLSFIEFPVFTRRWGQLDLDDGILKALQIVLMATPTAGTVIEGTGGLRKLRFSPPGWSVGKSGALRVCYAYYEEVATIALAIVYQKGEKDDLTQQEKDILRVAVERVGTLLRSRSYRCTNKTKPE